MSKLIPGKHGGKLMVAEPGESGNPKGRPPFQTISTLLKIGLSKPKKIKIKGKDAEGIEREITVEYPNSEILALRALQLAAQGRHNFLETVLERTEGKVPQTVNTNDITSKQPFFENPLKAKSGFEDLL